MSSSDLEILKEECRDHVNPAKLEKITTTINLWKELQDSNIIGINNIDFLQHLFTKINKHRLLEEVFNSPPSNGVGLQYPGPAATPNNRLNSPENIGSLSTFYPYSLMHTESSIDGFVPGMCGHGCGCL